MFRRWTAISTGAAILALSGSLATSAGAPPATAPARAASAAPLLPMRISFRLADGVRVAGELTAWDREGLDGSFGRRRWRDLEVEEVWKLRRRLMAPDDPAAWIDLGELLLELDGGTRNAERAFAQALRHDPDVAPRIEQARADVAARSKQREQLRRELEAERLSTLTPEAADWPATPWTPLTPGQLDAAVLDVHEQARAILAEAGLQFTPVRAQHFIVYSDLDRHAAATWARQLDLLYGDVAGVLGLAPDIELFHGKAAAFLLEDREAFRLIEAQAFGHLIRRGTDGICHFRGGDVFINVHHGGDERVFAETLLREAVHGVMHRYRSPRRLPPWANEGLAVMITELRLPEPAPPRTPRHTALEFIRAGHSVAGPFTLPYTDPGWPGPDDLGPALGALIVELMIRERRGAFIHWVDKVKLGKDWMIALDEDYGVAPTELVGVVERYYRVND